MLMEAFFFRSLLPKRVPCVSLGGGRGEVTWEIVKSVRRYKKWQILTKVIDYVVDYGMMHHFFMVMRTIHGWTCNMCMRVSFFWTYSRDLRVFNMAKVFALLLTRKKPRLWPDLMNAKWSGKYFIRTTFHLLTPGCFFNVAYIRVYFQHFRVYCISSS